MAGGGKESPRQQMINLMYLVLTAMLALQVSSSIINKFLELNEALIHSQEDAKRTNEATMKAFRKQVQEEGNKKEGVAAMKKADEVREQSAKMIKVLQDLKERVRKEVAGVDPLTGLLVNAAEETKLEILMVGANESGLGWKLEKDLKEYTASVSKTSGVSLDQLPVLAESNEKNELYKNDPIQRNKKFADANFAQTPAAAALAVLTHRQSEVLRTEGIILKKLGAEISGDVIKFDKISATSSVESNMVASGDKFKAKMFIFAGASNLKPRMTVNGSAINVDKDGMGEIVIPVSGGTEAGEERSWAGNITFAVKGKDTTFKCEGKYKVVKPVMSISSAAVSALYEGCGNELEVTVPALGTSYNPSFTAAGAACLPGSKKGMVIVVPSPGAREVTLNVSSGGMAIGSQKIQVRKVPAAHAIASGPGGSGPNNEYGDQTIPCPSSIGVKIIPDESFAAFLPKEASYRVESFEIKHYRGAMPQGGARGSGGAANIAGIKSKAREGDRISVVNIVAKRSNFRGEVLDAKITTKSIQVNVK